MSDLFEKASRNRFRYPSLRGTLGTEDLWDLPLKSSNGINLNAVAVNIHDHIEKAGNRNFVDDKTEVNQEIIDKLEILKHIIAYKKAAAERAQKAKDTRKRNQRIMQIMEEKKDDDLKGKSMAELKALLDDS